MGPGFRLRSSSYGGQARPGRQRICCASIPRHDAAFPRRDSHARVMRFNSPSQYKGRRECRELAAPMVACKKAGGSHHRFSRDIPAFPARWLYDLYVISLVRRAFWPPLRMMLAHQRVIPASGYQDHTISSSEIASLVHALNARASPSRPPPPRLACRDDRDTPLCVEAGWPRASL
jgi:hypothetical protein